MEKLPDWYDFQEDIATYFRSLGTKAETNKTISGARSSHDIDILVSTKFLSTDSVWLVEAKHWTSKVPKEKVLTLRSIVDDVGADKGLIIAKTGFQKGAYEVAENTNILLFTMDEFRNKTKHMVHKEILEIHASRARLLDMRYWSHSKVIRKKYGLRPDLLELPVIFSGTELLALVFKAIYSGMCSEYPINLMVFSKKKIKQDRADSFDELINWLNLTLNMIERILLKAEYDMLKNNEFNPSLDGERFFNDDSISILSSNSEYLTKILK